MCPKCEEEYVDPQDRRFHAQPNACSDCGPGLEFRTTENTLVKGDRALQAAEKWIRIGRVVAVKGLGGYHLMVDARNETAVARLRRRKRRSQKAFAVMYPDLEALRRHVDIPSFAESILNRLSPAGRVFTSNGGLERSVSSYGQTHGTAGTGGHWWYERNVRQGDGDAGVPVPDCGSHGCCVA